ncbi:carboxymuconolactone decarboxylase family protein [Actinocatenispora rupis]|uniref:Carboxymuconolactone decarboxylase-like domain-containing protein n=1 Tax=Actinocatenispora rupis TaxID=519421 RepID=A0A8J3NG92_9ACTN|nr:carboxymuconolactone decarboxylase family protein [Actinocatenispora rupis]GID16162.1 hypothetical protein Aru02nite_70510 [Actinocatenispora rupis]
MTTDMAPEQMLGAVARGDGPVLETLAQMQYDTLGRSGLPERTYHLVRIAALAAMGAPPASYLVNLAMASRAGVTVADIQGVLTAVAPIVGGPRVVAAAGASLQAIGVGDDGSPAE